MKGASSIPLAKAMDDCLVAYGMNGEAIRPQQGFPLRLIVPGFEGIYQIKYLRRIKVVDRYYMTYDDYGHIKPDARAAALDEPDRTEVGDHLPVRRAAAVRARLLRDQRPRVVRRGRDSQGGNLHRRRPELAATRSSGRRSYKMAHTRFGLTGSGTARSACSCRAAPTSSAPCNRRAREAAKYWNKPLDASFRVPGNDNTVQPWRIASDGSVHNGLA